MGKNPFIEGYENPPPTESYRLTVKNTGQVIEVDHQNLPPADDGQVGSILSILLANGVEVDHTCGGVIGCSTCHVYINKGFDSAPEPVEEEEDQLDYAPAVKDSSRLSCQCVPDGSENVEVEIPQWNRNEVSEEH